MTKNKQMRRVFRPHQYRRNIALIRRRKEFYFCRIGVHSKKSLVRLGAAIVYGLRGEIAVLRTTLSDARFYGRDPSGFADKSKALAAAEAALSAAEDRWLELELLRESLENR